MSTFHAFPTEVVEQSPAESRSFVGDGTPYLAVPGLKKLTGVQVGRVACPLTETRRYPTNPDQTEYEDVEEPLFQLATNPATGQPTLLRSTNSNHGLWQKGETILVFGDWEPVAVAEVEAAIAASKAKAAAENKATKAKAEEAKVNAAPEPAQP